MTTCRDVADLEVLREMGRESAADPGLPFVLLASIQVAAVSQTPGRA